MNKIHAFFLASWALLAPIHTVLYAMFFLVGCDTITGIWAALKRKEKFSSARLRSMVSKTVIYLVALICGFIAEKYMSLDVIPIVKFIAGAISLVETTSIVENLNSISGKNIFQELINKLGSPNLKKEE